jgi:NifU-like protein involved in Fe-S cluster formation
MEYSSEVRRRFLTPARAGAISSDDRTWAAGAAEDRSLNVWVRFQVQLKDSTIQQVRFQAYGCPHSLAASDLIASELEGRALGALVDIDLDAIGRAISLPREKHGMLLRIEDALAVCHAQAVTMVRE